MDAYSNFSDLELTVSLKQGDERAFRQVFDLHFSKLYVFCFRFLKNRERAEEIVHDALLNVWVNRDRLNEDLSVLPYLYTITRRLALNALRDLATSQRAIDRLWADMEKASNETEEAVLLSDLRQFTESALVHLPPQQQLIFRMSRYQGLSYDEIAEQLNLSRNTVKNHLVAALKTLRTHFNQSDVAYFILLSTTLMGVR
nr:RNA polymerase sigma-70 factor [uncultured Pedobacter sp.]